MRTVACYALLILLGGCAEPATLDCEPKPSARLDYDDEQKASLIGVVYARQLRDLALAANFGSGFGSSFANRISGSKAYSVKRLANQVRGMAADARAIDFMIESHGSIKLPAKSTKTCEMLADSIASLDTGQSDVQFLQNVSEVEKYFSLRFVRFGGNNLEDRVKELKEQ